VCTPSLLEARRVDDSIRLVMVEHLATLGHVSGVYLLLFQNEENVLRLEATGRVRTFAKIPRSMVACTDGVALKARA